MDNLRQDRPRVLIVDDQLNWREALRDMLDFTMYEIETAASYDEATHKLRQRAFHVLVSDQRLVDADVSNIQGILLLDELGELQDGTQAIIVTGYPTIEVAKEALRGGDAYDYLLKYPEEGGPFNIRLYREQVREAAKKAMGERQKAITIYFSLSALISGLTHDQIAETLFPEGTMPRDAPEGGEVQDRLFDTLQPLASQVGEVLTWLLYPLQPLARQMGRVWLSESERICEILCWSRNHGKATLARIGKDQRSLDAYKAKWLKESWHLVENKQFASAPLVAVSYTIDEMTFEDFVALVEEG